MINLPGKIVRGKKRFREISTFCLKDVETTDKIFLAAIANRRHPDPISNVTIWRCDYVFLEAYPQFHLFPY